MSKLIGSRGGKCFLVTVAGLTGKVGADDESEAIRLFRLHHNLPNDVQRPAVESAEFDPEEPEVEKLEGEKLDPPRDPKPPKARASRAKGNVAEVVKEETLKPEESNKGPESETAKPDGVENTEGEDSALDAASTSSEDSAKSQESDKTAE